MSAALASLSNNFMYAATAAFALAMLGHAGEWAYHRERRTGRAPAATGTDTTADVTAADTSATAGPADGADGIADGTVATRPRTEQGGPGGADPEDTRNLDRAALFARIGTAMTVLATFLLGMGVLTRGIAAERVPWSNLYEFTTTGTFLVCVAYLVAARKLALRWLALPITGLALVLVVLAVIVLYTPVAGLIPALQSYWLIIHVAAACIATAVFTVGAVTSILQLLRVRGERRALERGDGARGYLGRLPAADAIDRISYRLHAFAFPVWTFALITGAIWAREAWGRYWGWDPKEVWMFITWVCYAAYLHARATSGWRGKGPWIALVGYLALLFNLIGVNLWLDGLHSYA